MFDPRDYDGVTYASERRERDEERELAAQAREEETAREMAFHETQNCEDACYETCVHTAACCAAAQPVIAALAGWRQAQAIAVRMQEAA
jgi:hypothetical protein